MDRVLDLIDHASGLINITSWSNACIEKIDLYRQIFNSTARWGGSELCVFTFYVRVPYESREVKYRDTAHDHWLYDYDAMLSTFLSCVRSTNPGARVIWVTDLTTEAPADWDASIVRLPLDATQLMFERCKAMTAFIHSDQFCAPTLFVDTDAFIARDISPLLEEAFDVGVTIRDHKGFYMPINEGVLIAKQEAKANVQAFFRAYLAIYEALIEDEETRKFYGDIKRWRGGQLSLNALVHSINLGINPGGVKVKAFDCDQLNFCVDDALIDGKCARHDPFIVHFKGDSKLKFQEHFPQFLRL